MEADVSPFNRIRWGLVLLGGLLAQVALIVIVAIGPVVTGIRFGQAAHYIVIVTTLAVTFAFGFWGARRAGSRFILHGALVGAVAALIFVVVIALRRRSALVTPEFLNQFLLKILGGLAGGFAASRQSKRRSRHAG